MSDNQNATWWTPQGWEDRPAPSPYTELWADDTIANPDTRLDAVGYTTIVDRESNYDESDLKLNVWQHNDGHVSVEMTTVEAAVSQFFVAPRWVNAFFASKYLEIRQDIAHVHTAQTHNDIRRFLLAFIRHGHGEDTVNADGWQTRDEWLLAQKRVEEHRRRRAAEKKQAAP